MKVQQLARLATGVTYPIFIYNNSPETIKLNFVGDDKELSTNQFYVLEPHKIIQQWQKQYPKDALLPTSTNGDRWVEGKISITEIKEYESLCQQDLDEQSKRTRLAKEINANIANLSKLLSPIYSTEDHVERTHKKDKSHKSPIGEYLEIDQSALEKFIKTKVLKLSEKQPLSEKQMKQFLALTKMHNLLFRLKIYAELLQDGDTFVNYANLERDLTWCAKIALHYLQLPSSANSAQVAQPPPSPPDAVKASDLTVEEQQQSQSPEKVKEP
jgi:hypothetical protein